MALPPREPQSVLPAPPAPPAGDRSAAYHARWLSALGRLLTFCVVTASGLWTPTMLVVAHAIRPPQFANVTAYPRALLLALAADARQRMWTIVLASFVTLLAVAVVAIILNRRALRVTRGESSSGFGSLGWWATAGLLLALALAVAVAVVKLDLLPLESAALSLAVLAMAGAMTGVILSATTIRRSRSPAPGVAPRRRDLRQLGARVSLVLASLLLLAGFVETAFAAQFLAAFLLLFVY